MEQTKRENKTQKSNIRFWVQATEGSKASPGAPAVAKQGEGPFLMLGIPF